MARRIRKFKVALLISASLLFVFVLTAFFYTFVGVVGEVGTSGAPLSVADLSRVPQSVIEDAAAVAKELFGDYQDKYNIFVTQLLALYLEAKDEDFVVLFNSGGWGWNLLEASAGWTSIFGGMKSELQKLGYNALFVNYQRTEENLRGIIDEFMEVVSVYPTKAEKLAKRVEFLTSHVPDLKVIVAGESNGTIISDSVMNMLRYNQQVYSIQTGPPFWYKTTMRERTLVLESNGLTRDTFSEGDIGAILWASAKALLGLAPPDEDPGRILYFMRAPGHDYQWRYPHVYHEITNFLEKNFGFKRSKPS